MFREDADFALLISIEDVDEKSGTAKKTDVFSKRTIKPYEKITHCESALQALYVCKSEKGQIDLKYIEQLTGKRYDVIVSELEGKIYRNPEKSLLDEGDPYLGWEDASVYLSENVRKKLEAAEQAAETDERYQKMSRLYAKFSRLLSRQIKSVRVSGQTGLTKNIINNSSVSCLRSTAIRRTA